MLLEGVTASGKTAVYAQAIGEALDAGRGAIVLVPEIALALPLRRPAARRPGRRAGAAPQRPVGWRAGGRVATASAATERRSWWARGWPCWRRSPDPGVIVVDEEHDPAYKSDRTPRYQARDVALELGRLAGAPVILGSATPDMVSVGRARMGQLAHVRLDERAVGIGRVGRGGRPARRAGRGQPGPAVGVAGGRAPGARHERRATVPMLVINRRGSASVVLCRDCGYVQICPECQRPLVFHATAMALRCHHCGATAPLARRCPACASAPHPLPGRRHRAGGAGGAASGSRSCGWAASTGTSSSAGARPPRSSTTSPTGALDVLVGTSLVTKGLDVPEVTLVGVVSADIALTLPDERAAERTWQLLAQAVGRAGRGDRPGRAIIQTYLPDHPAIRAVAEGDARAFVEAELDAPAAVRRHRRSGGSSS